MTPVRIALAGLLLLALAVAPGPAPAGPIIVTGPEAGGGPDVRVFDALSGDLLMSFFAFDPGFLGGVRVGSVDANQDGFPDVIVAAGPGGGPHLRVLDGAALLAGALVELTGLFAYDPGLRSGMFIAGGNGAGAPTGGDITSVTAGPGLAGGGASGALTVSLMSCPASAVLKASGPGAWTCGTDNNAGGDITAVTAGAGLTGGGAGGPVTLAVDTAAIQARVTGACAAGQAIQVVNPDGTVSCQSLWAFGGNAGTLPGTHFLGTTDAVALELRANNTRALRLEPASSVASGVSPNLVGGFSGNLVAGGVVGATIAGGGAALGCPSPPCVNQVTEDFGTVGGGQVNTAGFESTVGGGSGNTASGGGATVGGGSGHTASGDYATVGGGSGNTASYLAATVGGGQNNTASAFYATVGGGTGHTANGPSATVGGGSSNTANGFYATVGGGSSNTANGFYATVPGGTRASASLHGQMAYASGRFAADGDAQTSLFVLRRTTANAAQAELFLDGAGARVTLAAGRTMTFDILVAARSTAPVGLSAGYHVRGVIENDAGATSFIGVPTVTPLGEDVGAWDVTVEADNTNDALAIKVTGAAATSIRWVAVVRTAEAAQ